MLPLHQYIRCCIPEIIILYHSNIMNKILFSSRESCLLDKSMLTSPHSICLICQDLPDTPLECSICKSTFCQLCTIKWKENSNSCPNRCSEKWMLEKVDMPDYKLACPYNKNCENLDTKNFEQHLLECQYAPQQIKLANRLKSQYRCVQEHKLVFNSDRLSGIYLAKCYECGEYRYCRNECQICKHFYCNKCRLPPLTKKYCPSREHQYINKNPHQGFTCEICQLQPLVLGIRCYDDMHCNFGVCQTCHDKLPEPEEPAPWVGSMAEELKLQWADKDYYQKYEDPDFLY